MAIEVPEDLPGMIRPVSFPPIPPRPPEETRVVAAQRYLTNIFHYFRKPLEADEVMAVVIACLDQMDDDTLFAWIETLLNGMFE